MKIIVQITDDGAWVELEQADGTMKKWSEELTDEEAASISAAGLLMRKGTIMHAMWAMTLSDNPGDNKKADLLVKLERLLNEAEKLAADIVCK